MRHAWLALPFLVCSVAQADPKPAVTFESAFSGNFSRSNRTASRINRVVIHTVEGSASSARNWFKNPRAEVSAHYIVAKDGSIRQMVRDKDRAWHARGSNSNSIGIEHAGYSNRNQWTEPMLRASAGLTRWLCDTYGIPKDRAHIVGHSEVGTSDHGDPGRYFDWDHYIRLVRGSGSTPRPVPEPLTVRSVRPGSGQTVGLTHMNWREGNSRDGYAGLKVEWESSQQSAARILVEEVGGRLLYDSRTVRGSATTHTIPVKLLHGQRYRWRVQVANGTSQEMSPWTPFNTDFEPATVTAISPKNGRLVYASPSLSWTYEDPQGQPQRSYRIYLDDDEDHSTILGDSKELNGATSTYFVRGRLKPDTTYYWRVMGYDGHGNPSFSRWQSFTTSPGYVHTGQEGVNVVASSPAPGASVRGRPTLLWIFHNGQQVDQSGFRILIEKESGERVVDESHAKPSRGYRARELPPGAYRWRVGVIAGGESDWSRWRTFVVLPASTGILNAGFGTR